MLVVAIRRNGRWLVPHGEDEISAGDLIYFAMDPGEMDNVLTLLGLHHGAERRVMVTGASRVGVELARRLEGQGVPVTLIDDRRSACEKAAAELGETLVIHGSPTDRGILEQEGADRVDGFAACSDDHEENVVSCLLARRLGAAHTFALVDNPALAGLIGEVGIDAVISPRLVAVSLALQFARRGRVTAVAALMEDEVEVIEAEAQASSRLLSGTLAELGLPRGILVAAVQRGEQIVVPAGNDRIKAGDRVLFITTIEAASRIDAFLE
jgi:trk system potassium uptake protein TrkA